MCDAHFPNGGQGFFALGYFSLFPTPLGKGKYRHAVSVMQFQKKIALRLSKRRVHYQDFVNVL